MARGSRRTNGEGSVYWNDSLMQYVGCLMVNGKRKYFYSGKGGTKTDVVRKIAAYNEELKRGSEKNYGKLTLTDGMYSWLKDIKMPELKPSSFDRLESTYRNQIVPRIGTVKVKDLSESIIQTELLRPMEKENLSVSSRKKAYDIMNAYLKYAAYKRIIKLNPMMLMGAPKKSSEEPENTISYLSAGDVSALRETALSEWNTGLARYEIGAAYLLILNTGLRMGEALALRWTDIDMSRQPYVLNVRRNLITIRNREDGTSFRTIEQSTPKTSASRRSIPLNSEACRMLWHLKRTKGTTQDGYVIHTKKGNRVLPREFERTLTRICDRAEIQRFGVHALRHTFATRLFEKGIDIKIISELLGHSDTGITYKVYIHVIENMKTAAIAQAFEV